MRERKQWKLGRGPEEVKGEHFDVDCENVGQIARDARRLGWSFWGEEAVSNELRWKLYNKAITEEEEERENVPIRGSNH